MTKCVLCPLHKDSKINLMNGEGPQPASILFVGEGPGEEEEKTGRPFAGPAGQLFDRLLLAAGIDRSTTRVTNIVRCRPIDKSAARTYRGMVFYGNRAPTEEEVYVCAPTYLEEEIRKTQPNIIVPVGNTALHYLLDEYKVLQYGQSADGMFTPQLEKNPGKISNIMAARGVETWNSKYSCKQIPIIHPSALLRGAKQTNVTIEDLKRIKEAAKTKTVQTRQQGHYVVVDSWDMVDWVIQRLEAVDEFSFDVETTGFDWMRDRLICVGFSWQSTTGVSVRLIDEQGQQLFNDSQRSLFISKMNEIFQNKQKKKIGFNLKFDAHHLMSYGIAYPRNSYDAMLAHHMLDSETEHSLKTLAWIYTDMGGYEDELDNYFAGKKKAEKDFLSVPRALLGKYNAMDCDCTLRLKHRFSNDMKQFPKMEKFFNEWVTEFSETVLTIERSGAPIDFNRIQDMHHRMSTRCTEIEKEFENTLGRPVNINSPKQLREVFFTEMKLPIIKEGKSGPSLDEEVLTELVKRHPNNQLVACVSEYRSLRKSMSTYLEGIKNSALFGRLFVDDDIKDACWFPEDSRLRGYVTDGRVHCDYLLHGTVTGRLSSRNPNLQNIPRVTKEDIDRGFVIRSVFAAEKDHKLLVADLKQAELEILYALSRDAYLRAALDSPEGVHLNFASRLFHIPWKEVSKEQKAIAKTVVFGIVYGRTAESIADQFGIPVPEAEGYVSGFHQTFPAASNWMREVIENAKRDKQVWSVFGRVRHLPAIDSPHKQTRQESENQAVNFPLQSPASDVTQIAGTRCRKEIEERQLASTPIWTTHDENAYHVPIEELEVMKEIVKRNMETFVPELGITVKAELEVFDRWKEEAV